jgi:beta-lactamase regulating signal transducer with metallopeptidase domain
MSAGSGADYIIPDISDGVMLPPAAASVSWWQIGFAVWLVGLVAFFAFHAVRHYHFAKLIKRWGENVTDRRLALLQSLQADMGISAKINLIQCASMDSPLLFGFANPCILLPREELDADELRFILKHELVHFKRKDLYYKGLVLLATAVHWFNPLVYLTARAINAQCELSCDDEVVRGTDADTRQQYSETIIGVIKYHTKLKPALSTNFYGGKKDMKNRISSIMDTGTKKAKAGILFATMTIAVLTFSILLIAAATPSDNIWMNGSTIDDIRAASPRAAAIIEWVESTVIEPLYNYACAEELEFILKHESMLLYRLKYNDNGRRFVMAMSAPADHYPLTSFIAAFEIPLRELSDEISPHRDMQSDRIPDYSKGIITEMISISMDYDTQKAWLEWNLPFMIAMRAERGQIDEYA